MDTSSLLSLNGQWPRDKVTGYDGDFSSLPKYLETDPASDAIIAYFASRNGLSYTPLNTSFEFSTNADERPAWLGTYSSMQVRMFAQETSGEIQGFPVSIGLFYYMTSAMTSPQFSVELARRSVVRVRLPKVFPQIYLDSNKNDKLAMSMIATPIKPSQKQRLEGDFNQYFDLYAPVGLQLNTLTLLAPNFMQQIMEASSNFDVEFYGHDMYLISRDNIYLKENMDVLLRALDEQLSYMARLMNSWSYTPMTAPFDKLQQSYSGAMFKLGRYRISYTTLIVALIIIFVVPMLLLFGLTIVLPMIILSAR